MTLLAEKPLKMQDVVGTVADIPGRWWVAQTVPQREKTLAREMDETGVGHFLPLFRVKEYTGGRDRYVSRPLFPSYLFFAGDVDTRVWVASHEYTIRTLHVHDQDQQQLRSDLITLELAIQTNAVRGMHADKKLGMLCEVTAGHRMRGVRGKIIGAREDGRFIIWIDAMGSGYELEIDPMFLDPIT